MSLWFFGLWSLSHCARPQTTESICSFFVVVFSGFWLTVFVVISSEYFSVELHIHSETLVYRIDVLVENAIANLWSSRHTEPNKKINQAGNSFAWNISVISSRWYIMRDQQRCADNLWDVICALCARRYVRSHEIQSIYLNVFVCVFSLHTGWVFHSTFEYNLRLRISI